jgi:replicative DNA helicase
MTLSAPIPVLKQQAKALARDQNIPLHEALDKIAQREGFSAWSLLSAKTASKSNALTLLEQLQPGELVLLGSRRGQGKTRLSIELALQLMQRGGRAAFFTLDFTPTEVAACFTALGAEQASVADRFLLDDSDQICADYIVARLASALVPSLVIVDYLQVLDHKRENPPLMHQVQQLKRLAQERQCIVLCLSQIERRYDPAAQPLPGAGDIRLPNPLDLSLFDKLCFLNQERLEISSAP